MLTFADPLLRAERCFAEREAIVDGDTRLTFADFTRRCRQVAGAVSAATELGDRVALLAQNRHETLELHLGVPVAGRAIVPLGTRLADVELVSMLDDCTPRVLVTDRSPEEVAQLAGHVERVVYLGDDYEDWIGEAEALELAASPAEPSTLAGLFYTGGTTGRSKGVMLSHANRTADTLHLGLCVRLSGDDSWVVLGPMYHASGIFQALLCVWQGARQLLLPAFDADAVLDLIERERATVAFGVPLMLTQLAQAQAAHARDASSLRLMGYGAAPASTALLERFHETFPHSELVSMYGATELAPMGSCLEHIERHLHSELARSAGRPVPGVRMRIVDPSGREMAPREIGELIVRGPNVMQGYWNNPEATEQALRDGWYHTGDLGYLDETGCLFLVDRAKDMIISGGENVYSSEVEEVLARHPGVLECAVFGVPDDTWGEAVRAAVVAREGVALGEGELRAHCRDALAGYKVPKTIDLHSEPLPRTAAGKLRKRDLREPFWRGRERRIHG